ncbi:MAG: phage major capsid protein [Phycisphaeraceae bacterium]|nr:phage major capsid protein [Phycisphaeraceae bacterium]
MELSAKQKAFFDGLMALAEQGQTLNQAVMSIVAEAGIKPDDMKALEAAVKQFESKTIPDLEKNLNAKLELAKRQAFTPDGRYRGSFGSEDEAKAFGLFALARCWGSKKAEEALKREFPDIHARTMDTVDTASVVPPEFVNRIQSLFESYGVFEADAFAMPMTRDSMTFLREKGEVTVFVVGEGSAPTASDIDFENVTLNTKKWGVLNYYSSELGEDAAVSIAEMLARSIARAFATKMDTIGFVGTGDATSFGIVGVSQRLLTVNGVDDGGGLVLGAGDTFAELTIGNHDALAGILPNYVMSPKYYCSRKYFFNVMVRLMHAAGGLTAGEIEGRRQLLFNGDPVRLAQVMPKTDATSQIPLLYGDLSLAATVGNRRQLTIKQSDQYKFAEDQITTLATRRVAVNVHDVGTATAAGPIVGLITAAS